MEVSAHTEKWRLRQPFRIANHEYLETIALVVQLSSEGRTGRGEAQGVDYLGETAESMMAQIDDVADELRQGASRSDLLDLLPAGGARNAVDCALWDLEAKQSGRTIWQLTGIEPVAVKTVFTIGIEATADEMAEKAAAADDHRLLKIKLDCNEPIARLLAIREARPDAILVVDANQSWSFELLQEVLPACAELGLAMIEQPLPRGNDETLEGFESPIPLAADESCQHTGELDAAARCYEVINIKLDKTGGLTEALNLADTAKKRGCKLMVGNMTGTSLAMAPSFVVAQLCDFVDIDGPLLLRYDRPNGLKYDRDSVGVFHPKLWG